MPDLLCTGKSNAQWSVPSCAILIDEPQLAMVPLRPTIQSSGDVVVPTLRLYFLGTLDIQYDGEQLPKPATLKSQSLLAYLVLHRHRPQPRDRLVGLFWGDRPESKARASLSTALWHIRRCLPAEGFILSDPYTVQFGPESDLWLDVDEFESQASHDDIASLQSAVQLYRGDFLDGFYDDWIINERYRLEALLTEALARLMTGLEEMGAHEAALGTAQRLLEEDALREDAHRLAMRAYCRLGRRNVALEQYRRCREIVGEELGTEPMAKTTELYHDILEGRLPERAVPEVASVEVPAVAPPLPSGRSPLDVVPPTRLVGREKELAFLHDCWQGAEAGQGGLVLISGEAGVGKTRLLDEFANRLRWQGVRTLLGRCYEFERALPYQPVAEALRAVLPTLSPPELAGFPTWSLRELARLAPEVLEKPGLSEVEGRRGVEITPSTFSAEDRTRLFEGVTRFVTELSSQGALLMVVEDLHWASEPTLQLLHFVARHVAGHQVLIVGTFRPEAIGLEHPLFNLRRRLTREGLVKPMRLARLSQEAVTEMVIEMSGSGEAVVPLARRLYEETEGNPFFVMEIVKALFESGVVSLEGGAWKGDFAGISEGEVPLPAAMSAGIQARVRCLNDDAQEALRLAAVLGREFDFDLLSAVWGRGEEVTLEALDDVLRHRLIEEGTGAMGRDYAFTHHKIQEVIYAGMSRRHRQHAHARVGMAMESLYGRQTEALAGELAFHFEQGEQHDEALTERAIIYLLQAGDRARGLYAHEEAIDYYQRALAFLKERGEYERAARTLMKLGLTYHTGFDFRQARQAYQVGFALWRRAGETRERRPLPTAPHALRMNWGEPPTLDPTLSYDVSSGAVICQLFSRLVEFSPEMEVVPDVARSWEVSEGGRKYVFHLRDDVLWSDGTPVTAGDFEYAWKGMLDPAAGWYLASTLYDVKGARSFHQGEVSDPDSVGVRALDEATLIVELEGPTCYFVHLLAYLFPVPRHVVKAYGDAWTEVGNFVTSGPFRLEAWQRGESMVLVRNPEYHGRFRGNLEQVTLHFLADWPAQLERYEADGLDVFDSMSFPPAELDDTRQRHAAEYVALPWLVTDYLGFNVSRPPFDDPRVRRAFVLATDRETLADVAMRGYAFPATGGFVSPGMPGHSAGIALPYDPAGARQLLAEAGYPGGCGFPSVEALTARGRESQFEYLETQWRENLGVEITWEGMEWATFLERLERDPPSMLIIKWMADYPDPDSFLRVCPARDYTRWRNRAYERLVEEARRVTDQGERMSLYGQADRILIEEAPIMPLTYGRVHLLVKPWVSKYPTSALERWLWRDVIIEPH